MPSFEAGVFRRETTTAHRTDDRFKKLDSAGQLRQLTGVQSLHGGRQLLYAPGSACSENPLSFVCRPDSRQASVAHIGDALDERAAEDDYGESRKTRGRKPARIILPAQLAEEMNG
jgi:hypothetical protein